MSRSRTLAGELFDQTLHFTVGFTVAYLIGPPWAIPLSLGMAAERERLQHGREMLRFWKRPWMCLDLGVWAAGATLGGLVCVS